MTCREKLRKRLTGLDPRYRQQSLLNVVESNDHGIRRGKFLYGTSQRSIADVRSDPDTWDLSRRLIRSLSFFNSAAGKTLPSASIGATFYTWNYKNEP